MSGKDLFSSLNGTPANLLVLIGLFLVLLAPVLPASAGAAADTADAKVERAKRMVDIELKRLEQAKEEDFERDKERAELEQRHGLQDLEFAALDARANAAGMRLHVFLNWIGRVLLLLGLLVLADRSEGMRQKVYLAVLILVLFGSLSGIDLNLQGAAHLGG
jgi:ABC-type transport system involved in cytochrome bd biosynthesis fused ATPase/permease subunit